MSSVILTGDTSGTLTVSAPLVAGSNTLTLAATTGTLSPLVSATAVTASGTSVDFTGIPSWAKRITVMFQGLSTNGTTSMLIQLGSGSFTTTGYLCQLSVVNVGVATTNSTAGFLLTSGSQAAGTYHGNMCITNLSSNTWTEYSVIGQPAGTASAHFGGGSIALGGTLDRIRITTVNGTDTFDAGTINIMYEG
jgi:hypothetical protein